jgi:hypothetical protein
MPYNSETARKAGQKSSPRKTLANGLHHLQTGHTSEVIINVFRTGEVPDAKTYVLGILQNIKSLEEEALASRDVRCLYLLIMAKIKFYESVLSHAPPGLIPQAEGEDIASKILRAMKLKGLEEENNHEGISDEEYDSTPIKLPDESDESLEGNIGTPKVGDQTEPRSNDGTADDEEERMCAYAEQGRGGGAEVPPRIKDA